MNYYLFIILLILLVWQNNIYQNDIYIVSKVDGKEYLVKGGFEDYQQASDTLSRLNIINKKLIEHMSKKYGGNKYTDNIYSLVRNYNEKVIAENLPFGTVNTSYVLNKGDAIRICLRDPITKKIHDFDTLLFVNLHELSHIFDTGWGHEKDFWNGFKVILENAKEIGVYDPVDFRKYPHRYCGMVINSNPYFS